MAWLGEARLATIGRLSQAMPRPTTKLTNRLSQLVRGFEETSSSFCSSFTCFFASVQNIELKKPSSRYQMEGAIVNQLRKLRLPVDISTSWKIII